MTSTERQKEWKIEFETRLAMAGILGTPTVEEMASARIAADSHVAAIELQEWKDNEKHHPDHR